jgi:FkbM family methyltransferase
MGWKSLVRRSLARMGLSIRRIPASYVSGCDLGYDLRILLKDRAKPLLLDVGANTGQTISFFLETFGNARIIAFEPSPATFATLSAHFGGRASVTLEQIALGDSDGIASLHVTQGHSVNHSLLEPVWEPDARTVPVQVATLDRYCSDKGLDNVDFLKIDTQGFDLNVLRGAHTMLAAKRIRSVYVEVMFTSMYRKQSSFWEIYSFLESHSYQFLGFYEQNYLNNRLWYSNACFIAS